VEFRSKIDIVSAWTQFRAVERLTLSIEDLSSLFIRLPASGPLTFSALSVLHTLSRWGRVG